MIDPIILLEDDPDDVFFVERALREAKIANPLVLFDSAAQARELLSSNLVDRPVLALVDMRLRDGETGVEFLRWLREQHGPLGSTPAMMLTGIICAQHHHMSRTLGSLCYLRKPITDTVFKVAIQGLGFESVPATDDDGTGMRIIRR